MGFVSRFIKSAHNLKSHFMYSCLHFMKDPDFWVISRPICPKNLISVPKQGHCKLRNEFCMIQVFWHLQNSCFRELTCFTSLCTIELFLFEPFLLSTLRLRASVISKKTRCSEHNCLNECHGSSHKKYLSLSQIKIISTFTNRKFLSWQCIQC